LIWIQFGARNTRKILSSFEFGKNLAVKGIHNYERINFYTCFPHLRSDLSDFLYKRCTGNAVERYWISCKWQKRDFILFFWELVKLQSGVYSTTVCHFESEKALVMTVLYVVEHIICHLVL